MDFVPHVSCYKDYNYVEQRLVRGSCLNYLASRLVTLPAFPQVWQSYCLSHTLRSGRGVRGRGHLPRLVAYSLISLMNYD